MLDIIHSASVDSCDVPLALHAWSGEAAAPKLRAPRDLGWDLTQRMWSHLAPPKWAEMTADRRVPVSAAA